MNDNAKIVDTPDFSSVFGLDFFRNYVYEPSEDSFLLIDALAAESAFFHEVLKPRICVEIGCGSGVVITSLAKILGSSAICLATDINPVATLAGSVLSKKNNAVVDFINCDLLGPLKPSVVGKVDILIFNPPYVVTTDEEFGESTRPKDIDFSSASSVSDPLIAEAISQLKNSGAKTVGISASWAGGENGRQVTDRVLAQVKELLSEKGCFYLVALTENKPSEIVKMMKAEGFEHKVVLKRRAGIELLSIIRFQRSM
mmetsp:Transcript_22100/g.30831  ORF Transcript_22100/g.30831 Transcript_22100/m.30831 type:complete len:257 (+) Transcript_22100:16-786(+)